MDFDPSAFLSVAMTEDQDSVYTAPDVPQGFSQVKIPSEKIVVEGGLQMEQNVQIPVPVFGLLQQNEAMEEEREANKHDENRVAAPIHIDMAELETSTTPQPSPGERTSSPSTKKIIHVTHDETRFRKEFYCGHYERVKIFRLHCSICDRHLGCAPWFTERQMRIHKLLSVAVCRKCFEFYGDINFPIEEGSELYCSWCGEGGECFCCSTCPKIVCKKCVKRNFGAPKIKEIDKNDDWSCFVCKPEDIWPHRALMWGLQRWSRGMRQLVALLPKEEKLARLSLDTSHCCLKEKDGFSAVGLPSKGVLSKVPPSLIAVPYQAIVKEVLACQDLYTSTSNGIFAPNSLANTQTSRGIPAMNNVTPVIPETVSRVPGNLSPQVPRASIGYHVRQQVQQVVHRNTITMNRPPPYPVKINTNPVVRPAPPPHHHQFAQRVMTYQTQLPYEVIPPTGQNNTPYHPPELIDLEIESLLKRSLQPPLMDISSLENSIREVKDVLRPTLMLLDQFSVIKNELGNDFAKLTSFSERLSYNIKIAICNLAKVNTDLIESHKKIVDSRVSTVVHNIQSSVENKVQFSLVNSTKPANVNGTLNPQNQRGKELNSRGSNPYTIVDSSSEIIEVNPNSPSKTPEPKTSSSNIQQTTPSSSSVEASGEEVEDVAIAMLCETVLEVEDNKENKDDANKDQRTPVKEPQQINNKVVKGTSKFRGNLRKRPHDQSVSSKVQVIDLIDEEEEEKVKFDESYYGKKFKIVPCKVVLERLEILKVDVV